MENGCEKIMAALKAELIDPDNMVLSRSFTIRIRNQIQILETRSETRSRSLKLG
jgi:hypothetical protein